jgi:hypothetical protein
LDATLHRQQEDFPIESFRYLEGKLQAIRKMVMDYAAKIAADRTNPDLPIYIVQREHVDEALGTVLSDTDGCRRAVGLPGGLPG